MCINAVFMVKKKKVSELSTKFSIAMKKYLCIRNIMTVNAKQIYHYEKMHPNNSLSLRQSLEQP